MNKNERYILKAFLKIQIPLDFDKSIDNISIVSSIYGLVTRFYSGEIISKEELDLHKLNSNSKSIIEKFVSNNIDNLIFYNLLKICIFIMYKYSM